MKKISMLLVAALLVSLLAGCAGTPVVYYTDCTCPPASHEVEVKEETVTEDVIVGEVVTAEGALKTGLAITTGLGKSASATAEAEGAADYDVTMVAVLVDDNGVIQDCKIDGIASSIKFDTTGAFTAEPAAPATKNEQGENYGMVAWGGAIAEWDAQAAALASFAIGKTAEELRAGAIDETGYAPEGTDLATSATIYLGGYVAAIEKAVANAQHLGAQAGDELKLACTTGVSSSAAATADAAGNAQLDVDVTALTLKDGVITSCAIDSVQAKVAFDTTGTITSDLAAPATKNEQGENYGMVAWGGAIAEWDAQAAAFASYVTGMTAEEVSGIAIAETTKPAEGTDLATSVTISVIGFMNLVTKACQ